MGWVIHWWKLGTRLTKITKGPGYGARHPRLKSKNGGWGVGYKHGGPSAGSGEYCRQEVCENRKWNCRERTKNEAVEDKRGAYTIGRYADATNQIENKAYKECEARLAPVGRVITKTKYDTSPKKAQYARTHLHLHTRKQTQGWEQANGPLRTRGKGWPEGEGRIR